jgi:hypothetical protein
MIKRVKKTLKLTTKKTTNMLMHVLEHMRARSRGELQKKRLISLEPQKDSLKVSAEWIEELRKPQT